MVLGMRSSEVGCTDFRLILDLKRVLIKVDFPKPLCPGERTRLVGRVLQRWQLKGLGGGEAWESPPSSPWWGSGSGAVRRQEGLGAWAVAKLLLYSMAEQDMAPLPSDHRVVKLPHARSRGSWEELRGRQHWGEKVGAGLTSAVHPQLWHIPGSR